MIRISKRDTELDALAQKHLGVLKRKPFLIEGILRNDILATAGSVQVLFQFLLDNIDKILCARPPELNHLKAEIEHRRRTAEQDIRRTSADPNADIVKLDEQLARSFKYGKFISNKRGHFAYELAQGLDAPVCLYCNRQYTFTLKKKKKTRPQFDHFFDKASFPYLALSFYNLVPCCSICNSSFKGTTKFTLSDNFHPLIEGAERTIRFSVGITSVDFLSGKDFEVKVEPYDESVSTADLLRINNNLDTFAIVDLYNMHKDYIANILLKAHIYGDSMISELLKYQRPNNTPLFGGKKEVVEFILGNYVTPENLGKRPLAKLTYDLARELQLID